MLYYFFLVLSHFINYSSEENGKLILSSIPINYTPVSKKGFKDIFRELGKSYYRPIFDAPYSVILYYNKDTFLSQDATDTLKNFALYIHEKYPSFKFGKANLSKNYEFLNDKKYSAYMLPLIEVVSEKASGSFHGIHKLYTILVWFECLIHTKNQWISEERQIKDIQMMDNLPIIVVNYEKKNQLLENTMNFIKNYRTLYPTFFLINNTKFSKMLGIPNITSINIINKGVVKTHIPVKKIVYDQKQIESFLTYVPKEDVEEILISQIEPWHYGERFICLVNGSTNELVKMLPILKELQDIYQFKVKFAFYRYYGSLLSNIFTKLGVRYNPKFMFTSSSNKMYYVNRHKAFTKENAINFIDKILSHQMHHFTSHEIITKLIPDGSNIKRYSSLHLFEILALKKYTLIYVYIDNCLSCQSMLPIIEQIATHYLNDKNVNVGMLNYHRNYIQAFYIEETEFPYIYVMTKDLKHIKYPGNMSFDEIIIWLDNGMEGKTTNFFEFKNYEPPRNNNLYDELSNTNTFDDETKNKILTHDSSDL